MRVGVISEGRADFAVVRNVLKAVLGLDAADVDSIRPDLQVDETDPDAARAFSNWEIVKQECLARESLVNYLGTELAEERLVVVHIDAAECEQENFGVARPDRARGDYVSECREAVASAMRGWINDPIAERVVEAVAVEETDAWILPLYDGEPATKRRDSGSFPNPKKRLEDCLGGRLKTTHRLSDNDRMREG